MGRKMKDYSGQTFGKLTAIRFSHRLKSLYYWACECSCGNQTVVATANLLSGTTKSCGCLAEENSIGSKRLVRIYHSMIQRCHNANYPNYHYYGAKGITVCEDWRNSSRSFYEWAFANGYSEELELDREKNTMGYGPENCRWITHAENMRNKSDTIHVTYLGETEKLSNLCDRLQVDRQTVYELIKRRSKSPEEAIGLAIKRGRVTTA